MQGINKAKHVHLIDALLQMERLLAREQRECSCLQQASQYRQELEKIYQDYECLIKELSEIIIVYETSFSQVKVHFLGKKLKQLKRNSSATKPLFTMLRENVRMAYIP